MIDSCPSRARWSEWLDADLNDAERGELAAHLEGCLHCQRLLDGLKGVDGGWADAAREATAAAPAPELARAMDELKRRPGPEAPLNFLAPSADPAKLGTFDGYEVLSEVGRGGMGVVLKAYDPRLQRLVAIKVLGPHLAASAPARARFLREARAAAAVVHENVVTVHAVAESAGTPYLVMELVAGRSLQDRLDQDGPLELKEVLRIGMQAAAGLAAAHAQGLVHRDIKPANILLENGVERVKLADFGLARATDDARLTASGVLAGSPHFMSPEQARGEAVGPASDLFALGAVLYTMAAGRPPFRAPNALAVLKRVCDDPPRSLRQINPDIPEWLEAIVFKLLAKDPDDRFASADDVAQRLGQHLRHLQNPEAPAPSEVIAPMARPGSKAGSGSKSGSSVGIVLAIVAAALLTCVGLPVGALLLLLFWGYSSVEPQPQPPAARMEMAEPAMREGMVTRPGRMVEPDRVALRERPVAETLVDVNAKELELMRAYLDVRKATYDGNSQTVRWEGVTKAMYRTLAEAEVNMNHACREIRFHDKDGRLVGSARMTGALGKRQDDGRYLVFLTLKLSGTIVKNAVSLELVER